MKATSLGAVALTCSTMSTVGPQTRLWQSKGVANVDDDGPLAEHVGQVVAQQVLGWRAAGVDLGGVAADVGQRLRVDADRAMTDVGWLGPAAAGDVDAVAVVTSRRASSLAMAITACLPVRLNGTSAT